MARPPLPVGTYGSIRCTREKNGTWTARAAFRDYDGRTRDVERTDRTKALAENKLKAALRDRAKVAGSDDLGPDSKFADAVGLWWDEWQRGENSPNTVYAYRRKLDLFVLPALGELRCRELTVGRVARFLRDVEDNHGAPNAKQTRAVLSGVCGLAAKRNALPANPVRDSGAITVKARRASALSIAEEMQLLAYASYDVKAIRRDLLDLIAFLVASGVRIGEALGLRWNRVDFDAGTVTIRLQVIRVVGRGLVLKEPKSDAGVRVLKLPKWAMGILELRKLTAGAPEVWPVVNVLQPDGKTIMQETLTAETAMVFPSTRTGRFTPRDPSNVEHELKEAFAFAGLDITSHKFRKTVLTEMDNAGLSANVAADHAGHSKASMTQDTYIARRKVNTAAADILEVIGDLWA